MPGSYSSSTSTRLGLGLGLGLGLSTLRRRALPQSHLKPWSLRWPVGLVNAGCLCYMNAVLQQVRLATLTAAAQRGGEGLGRLWPLLLQGEREDKEEDEEEEEEEKKERESSSSSSSSSSREREERRRREKRARSLLLPLLSTFAALDRRVAWRRSVDPAALAAALQVNE